MSFISLANNVALVWVSAWLIISLNAYEASKESTETSSLECKFYLKNSIVVLVPPLSLVPSFLCAYFDFHIKIFTFSMLAIV